MFMYVQFSHLFDNNDSDIEEENLDDMFKFEGDPGTGNVDKGEYKEFHDHNHDDNNGDPENEYYSKHKEGQKHQSGSTCYQTIRVESRQSDMDMEIKTLREVLPIPGTSKDMTSRETVAVKNNKETRDDGNDKKEDADQKVSKKRKASKQETSTKRNKKAKTMKNKKSKEPMIQIYRKINMLRCMINWIGDLKSLLKIN